jgi:hypothetical protein
VCGSHQSTFPEQFSGDSLTERRPFNLFVFGSGFTRAAIPEAPLNRDLLGALIAKGSASASQLKDRYVVGDIEIALTRLDCDISTEEAVGDLRGPSRALRRSLETELAEYFLEFCASESLLTRSEWLTAFIDKGVKPRDVAISLNYDCLLEGALDWREKWSPRGGYGFPVENPLFSRGEYRKSPVTVLKIHGSANFVLAPFSDQPAANSLGFTFDGQLFPRSGKNKNFGYGGGMGQRYVIAPSYVKVPTVEVTYMMLAALNAASKAQNLVFIGSSLRPEDQFLTVLMTHFLHQRDWQDRHIVVVSPAAREVCERIKLYWGVNVSRQVRSIAKPIETSVDELLRVLA